MSDEDGGGGTAGGISAGSGASVPGPGPEPASVAGETCRRAWWQRRAPLDFEQEIERLKAPDGGALLPWLLMAIGPATDIGQGEAAPAWLAAAGLAVFCVLYVATVRAAFGERLRSGPVPMRLLGALAATALALAIGYGGDFTLLFVLVSLCVGSVSRGRRTLGLMLVPLSATAGLIAGLHHEGFWSTAGLAYGTFLSGLVVSVIITLFHAVARLKETRQELARAAVAQERLRFSRDLHDLLGHTLSVIVVKSEAAQRIAARDVDAALAQVADIETVGRQALTEIREAVTGYREGSLATELARARSALAASDVDLVWRASGQPLPAAGEELFGWVLREGVTNVVRHSGARRVVVELRVAADRAELSVADDGCGLAAARPAAPRSPVGVGTDVRGRVGTGLRGLTERLDAAGGTLRTTSSPEGFTLTATLPLP